MVTVRTIEDLGTPEPGCPKAMVFGPCGGVRGDGTCEVGDRPCPFVGRPLHRWPTEDADHRPVDAPAWDPPVIVVDLRVRPFDVTSIRQVTMRLCEVASALLVGEHHSRPDFPPSYAAALVMDAGGSVWATLTCRDRNRVVLEAELAALASLKVAGVHCVTGDARAPAVRRDASQVFDLDSLRLTAIARLAGLRVSVAATPLAPPIEARPTRLLDKQRAGASLCFVNHSGGPERVRGFVEQAIELGVGLGFVPCVPVVTDEVSWLALQRFPGLVLDPAVADRVLSSPDPRAAGITFAVEYAREMLAIPGVVGVDLSGSATAGDELEAAAVMAEVCSAVRESTPSSSAV